MKPSALLPLVVGIMLVADVAVQARPARMVKYVHVENLDGPVAHNQTLTEEEEGGTDHHREGRAAEEETATFPSRMETSTFGSDPDEDFDDGLAAIGLMVVQKMGRI
ncbi:uncharacterized protein [Panulirus ornatus]|uniref:uncharacterized protein isoform X2 n=1 Tax=Panulirus ornatus TaxID=150431 RepID=UPI003A87C6B1